MVADDPHHRPPARIVHHRTGRNDDLRAAPYAAILRTETQLAFEARDPWPAVREHLDRWHADAFCRPAGPDGGAALGLGHPLRTHPHRLAGRSGAPRLEP